MSAAVLLSFLRQNQLTRKQHKQLEEEREGPLQIVLQRAAVRVSRLKLKQTTKKKSLTRKRAQEAAALVNCRSSFCAVVRDSLFGEMQSAGGSADQPHPLFGGALSAVIPHSATDISELREIPDNQEVFAHAHTDQSLIVELVEYQTQVADQDAARYHFEDIAGSNKALEPGAFEVTSVVALPKPQLSLSECSSAWMLTGTQCVSKFNEDARNTVTLHLGLLRLQQFSTDVLITFNDPQSISPDSSSASAVGTHKQPWTVQEFQRLLQTLTLHNPGLFG
uniref:Ran guanine nucleotide release factor n=1 Tax=Acanthochromis polyacanthus TaxID=80966 RepID=A0A3Q1GN58_9TELE